MKEAFAPIFYKVYFNSITVSKSDNNSSFNICYLQLCKSISLKYFENFLTLQYFRYLLSILLISSGIIFLSCSSKSNNKSYSPPLNFTKTDINALDVNWNLVFADSFSNPANLDLFWSRRYGNWKIENGELVGKAESNNAGIIVFANFDSIYDAAVEFEAYTLNPTDGIICYFLKDPAQESKGYALSLGTQFNAANAIIKNRYYIISDKNKLKCGERYNILFIHRGKYIMAYINGSLKFSFSDRDYITSEHFPYIAVGSYWGLPEVHFDNFKIFINKSSIDNSKYDFKEVKTVLSHELNKHVPITAQRNTNVLSEASVPYRVFQEELVNVTSAAFQTETIIRVNLGDTLSFVASGAVKCSKSMPIIHPEGISAGVELKKESSKLMFPTAPLGALIGRIGQNGSWFIIGVKRSVSASTGGVLYLAINDYNDKLNENDGFYTVKIIKHFWSP